MTVSFRAWARVVVVGLGLAMAGLSAMPVTAQELAPDHLALARKYIDLTDTSQIFEVTMVETAVETMRVILSQNPEIADAVDAAIGKTLEGYRERKGELLDQFARVYALHFTIEELQEIVTFYESPVGQKLATTNATINQDIQSVMQVFETNTKTEFFAKVRAELKAAGIDV